MIVIRTAEDMARAIETAPDTELRNLLAAHAERLAEFELSELAEFVIVQPGDTLDTIEEACDLRLVADGQFMSPVELIAEHTHYFEVTWILSDDGFGLVLLVSKSDGTDPQLLAACRNALNEHQPHQQTRLEP